MKRPIYKTISFQELKQGTNDVFEQYDEIQLAYLYGSYANATQTEFSDIDIGIVLTESFKESALYFAELSVKIEKSLNFQINIDLRILNEATPRFLFQVIKNNKILYCKNKTFMHEFELKVMYEYQDIKPMLDMYDKISVMEVFNDENDRDVLLTRFKKMDNLIQNLKEIKKKPKDEFLSNYLLYLSTQRALEMCINICIDVGNHILSMNKNGKPETYGDIFTELSKLGLIDKELKEILIKMVKFRNLLGHLYMEISNEKIYEILQENLDDFNLFKKEIYSKFKEQLLNEN